MADDEVLTRAVGPYVLQKTLGKGQTGKEAIPTPSPRSYLLRMRSRAIAVCCRSGEAGRSLCDAANCRSQDYQQREAEQECYDEGIANVGGGLNYWHSC